MPGPGTVAGAHTEGTVQHPVTHRGTGNCQLPQDGARMESSSDSTEDPPSSAEQPDPRTGLRRGDAACDSDLGPRTCGGCGRHTATEQRAPYRTKAVPSRGHGPVGKTELSELLIDMRKAQRHLMTASLVMVVSVLIAIFLGPSSVQSAQWQWCHDLRKLYSHNVAHEVDHYRAAQTKLRNGS